MHPDQDLPPAAEAQATPMARTLALAPVETTGRVAELHQQLLAMLRGDEPACVDAAAVERIDGAALQLLLAAHLTFGQDVESATGGPDGLQVTDPSDAFLDASRILGLTALARPARETGQP